MSHHTSLHTTFRQASRGPTIARRNVVRLHVREVIPSRKGLLYTNNIIPQSDSLNDIYLRVTAYFNKLL